MLYIYVYFIYFMLLIYITYIHTHTYWSRLSSSGFMLWITGLSYHFSIYRIYLAVLRFNLLWCLSHPRFSHGSPFQLPSLPSGHGPSSGTAFWHHVLALRSGTGCSQLILYLPSCGPGNTISPRSPFSGDSI